jgi:hypothetical protein
MLKKSGGSMSGGSYQYLCNADVDELLNKEEIVQEMADRLAGLGYAKDAARETQVILLTLRQFSNRIEAMRERLSGVWEAVEWWDSNDRGEEGLKKALEVYRGGEKEKEGKWE